MRIQCKSGSLFMDVRQDSPAEGAQIVVGKEQPTNGQLWRKEGITDNRFYLVSRLGENVGSPRKLKITVRI